jgi:hypothetical protein
MVHHQQNRPVFRAGEPTFVKELDLEVFLRKLIQRVGDAQSDQMVT